MKLCSGLESVAATSGGSIAAVRLRLLRREPAASVVAEAILEAEEGRDGAATAEAVEVEVVQDEVIDASVGIAEAEVEASDLLLVWSRLVSCFSSSATSPENPRHLATSSGLCWALFFTFSAVWFHL